MSNFDDGLVASPVGVIVFAKVVNRHISSRSPPLLSASKLLSVPLVFFAMLLGIREAWIWQPW